MVRIGAVWGRGRAGAPPPPSTSQRSTACAWQLRHKRSLGGGSMPFFSVSAAPCHRNSRHVTCSACWPFRLVADWHLQSNFIDILPDPRCSQVITGIRCKDAAGTRISNFLAQTLGAASLTPNVLCRTQAVRNAHRCGTPPPLAHVLGLPCVPFALAPSQMRGGPSRAARPSIAVFLTRALISTPSQRPTPPARRVL